MIGAISRFLRDGKGATAIEFAFVLPIMMLLIAGVFEYSRVLLAQHMIRDIVDEAARTGVIKGQADDEINASVSDQMDDVPGVGAPTINVTSTASTLSVSVTVSMDLVLGELLPSSVINFTVSNEYPK